MAIVTTNETDTLNSWRLNLNDIHTKVGDVVTLTPPIAEPKTVVPAINNLYTKIGEASLSNGLGGTLSNAVNNLLNNLGDISTLATTSKIVTNAINEVHNGLGTMSSQNASTVNIIGGSIQNLTTFKTDCDISPTTTNARSLGTSILKFKDAYLTGTLEVPKIKSLGSYIEVQTTVAPPLNAPTATIDLGTSANKFRSLYANSLNISGGTISTLSTFSSSIIPTTANTIDIGSNILPIKTITTNNLSVQNLVNSNLIPTNSTINLGNVTNKWNGYFNKTLTTSGCEQKVDVTIANNVLPIDLSLGQTFIATLNSAATITITNRPAIVGNTSNSYGFVLILIGNGNSYTVTWPNIQFVGGIAPTLSSASGSKNILSFIHTHEYTPQNAPIWYCISGGLGIKAP